MILLKSLVLGTIFMIENCSGSGFSYEDFAQQFYSANNNNPSNDNSGKIFYQPNVVSSQQPGQPITIDVPPLVVPVNFNLRSKSPHQQGNLLGDVIGRLKPDVYFTPDARQILDKGIDQKSRQLFAYEVPSTNKANNNQQTGSLSSNKKETSKKETPLSSAPAYEASFDSSYDKNFMKNSQPEVSSDYFAPPSSSSSYSDSSSSGIKLHHFQVKAAPVEREAPMTKEREMLLNYLANYKPIQPGVHHIRSAQPEAPEMSPRQAPLSLTNSNPLLGNKPWFIETPESANAGQLDAANGQADVDDKNSKLSPLDMDSSLSESEVPYSNNPRSLNSDQSLLDNVNQHHPLDMGSTSDSSNSNNYESMLDMPEERSQTSRKHGRTFSHSSYDIPSEVAPLPPPLPSSPSAAVPTLPTSSSTPLSSPSRTVENDYRSMTPIDRLSSSTQRQHQPQQQHHHHHHRQQTNRNPELLSNSERHTGVSHSSSYDSELNNAPELKYGQRIPKKHSQDGHTAESVLHRKRLPLAIRSQFRSLSSTQPEQTETERFTPLHRPSSTPYRFRDF